MLDQVFYDESIDIWALGVILFELLHGVTPFHSPNEEELIQKMKGGHFKMTSKGEPIYIETCLFLLDCLQIEEENRLDVDSLLQSPFINEEHSGVQLHEMDYQSF